MGYSGADEVQLDDVRAPCRDHGELDGGHGVVAAEQ
jgi:hypothetical protein